MCLLAGTGKQALACCQAQCTEADPYVRLQAQ